MTMEALKPCPFCGSEPRRVKIETQLTTGTDVLFVIECSSRRCGAKTIPWYPIAAADAAWNQRKDLP